MQIQPASTEAFVAEDERGAGERSRPDGAARARQRRVDAPEPVDPQTDRLVLRVASDADAAAVARIGQLDAGTRYGLHLAALARSPENGALMVAEAGGSLVAALDVRQDRVVADPFQRSAAARELLELRARQLRRLHARPSRSRRRLTARLMPRTG